MNKIKTEFQENIRKIKKEKSNIQAELKELRFEIKTTQS